MSMQIKLKCPQCGSEDIRLLQKTNDSNILEDNGGMCQNCMTHIMQENIDIQRMFMFLRDIKQVNVSMNTNRLYYIMLHWTLWLLFIFALCAYFNNTNFLWLLFSAFISCPWEKRREVHRNEQSENNQDN